MHINFTLPGDKKLRCEGKVGQSLLHLAQANGIDLEGSCDSSLACATCHVVIEADWYDHLCPPSNDELDMLDLATGQTRTSRLSCQIKLTEDLDGLAALVP